MLLPSALLPLLCTTHRVQGPAAPQISVMPHLLTCPGPLPFLSTHGGPIGQHCLQRAGALHSWCCGVQHTPCCAPRQHCPLTGAILPSVSLPNTCLVQSESVKAPQNLLPDSLKDPHKVPQYPHCLSQEINISLPHNHVHIPVPCTPQLYLLWAVQNNRGLTVHLDPNHSLGEQGVFTDSTAALGKPRLREHSKLDLPNTQEWGHGAAVLLM